MSETPSPADYRLSDPALFAQNMTRVYEIAGHIAQVFSGKTDFAKQEMDAQVTPVDLVVKTLGELAQSYTKDPQKLMEAQSALWNDYTLLWQNAWRTELKERG